MLHRGLYTLVAWLLFAGSALGSDRIALVIGNGAYQHAAALSQPQRDAAAVGNALIDLDFTVYRLDDARQVSLTHALTLFEERARTAEAALIYFAGHALAHREANFLLPVDAPVVEPEALETAGVALERLEAVAGAAQRFGVVIVDAAGQPPYPGQRHTGLAEPKAHGDNRLLIFSTAGTPASLNEARDGAFAGALAAALGEPGLALDAAFEMARATVLHETGGRQAPALFGRLTDPTATLHAPAPPPVEVARDDAEAMREHTLWAKIRASERAEDFLDYLMQYPDGVYAEIAERRIHLLRAAERARREAPVPQPLTAPATDDPEPESPLLETEVVETAPADDAVATAELVSASDVDTPATQTALIPTTAEESAAPQAPAAVGGWANQLSRLLPSPAIQTAPEEPAESAPDPAAEGLRVAAVPSAEPELEIGRQEIRAAQIRLNILGFEAGSVDGIAGAQTARAIAAFERAEGLPETGRLSTPVLARLRRAVSSAEVIRHEAAAR
ncbi:MAG: caspase family protein [Pseudomonadota bacterium]